MVSAKTTPSKSQSAWWRCGDNSPLSCADSTVVMGGDDDQPIHSTPATNTPRLASSIQGMRSLMHGIVSPIMSCVTPPLSMCTMAHESRQQYDFDSWQQRHHQQQRYGSTRREDEYFIYLPKSCASSDLSSPPKMHSSPSCLPLENIETCHIHCNDVLCGRANSNSTAHVGNRNFRDLIAANRDTFVGLSRKQKQAFARRIVDLVHSARPKGRFLMRDSATGLWNDIGMARSIEKTIFALAEMGNSSSVSVTGSSPSEDRSMAPTAASVSLASVATTPASNNSHQSKETHQIIIPPHLKHVYQSVARNIPSHVSPRIQNDLSLEPHAPADCSSLYPLTPLSPRSPYLAENITHQSLPFPSPMTATSTLQGSKDGLDVMACDTPPGPPDIWRIHKTAVLSFPGLFGSDQPKSPGTTSDCDSLKQLQQGHTLVQPSIERVSTAEWNGMSAIGP